MANCGVSIFSTNLSGLTTEVTFFPESGGTVNLGTQTFPFTYISDYYYGTYNCYVPTYAYTYTVVVPLPTPTPTPTNTETPTPTSTPTPTPPLNFYYNSTPVCDTINLFENVIMDGDLCSATTITSTTVLPDGNYWITNSIDGRRYISANSGVYTFAGSCVGCA